MKKALTEEDYQRMTIGELKKEALKRNLVVPHPSTKNYLIYLLTNPSTKNQEFSNKKHSVSAYSSSDENFSTHHHHSSRTYANNPPIPTSTSNTVNKKSSTREKKETRQERSPLLPTKNSHNHQKQKKKPKEKKKESFFNNMNFLKGPYSYNNIINYCVLILLLTFGLLGNQIYLILFGVFLIDLISTEHIKIINIKQSIRNNIMFIMDLVYIGIALVFPFCAILAIISSYLSRRISYNYLSEFDLFLIIIDIAIWYLTGAPALVVIMIEQHLVNTNSKLVDQIFNFMR